MGIIILVTVAQKLIFHFIFDNDSDISKGTRKRMNRYLKKQEGGNTYE